MTSGQILDTVIIWLNFYEEKVIINKYITVCPQIQGTYYGFFRFIIRPIDLNLEGIHLKRCPDIEEKHIKIFIRNQTGMLFYNKFILHFFPFL